MKIVLFVFAVCVLLAAKYGADGYSAPAQRSCNKEEDLKCVHKCPPERTCKNRDIQFSCAQDDPCQEKCVCKVGLYRNPRGDCITEEQCNQCSGPNEYYACWEFCDNECETLHEMNQTSCPIKSFVCNKKCYCEEGYARNKAGECVPFHQCH